MLFGAYERLVMDRHAVEFEPVPNLDDTSLRLLDRGGIIVGTSNQPLEGG